MKKSIFLAVAAVAMTACSNDVDLGMKDANKQTADNAIGFEVRNKNMSRAKLEEKGHYNFGVFAYKNSSSLNTIMEDYLVGYHGTNHGYDMTNSNQSTLDNSNWAYEKLGNKEYKYTGDVFYKAAQKAYMSNLDYQYLRYWDFSTTETSFYAYAPYINKEHNGLSTGVTFDYSTKVMSFPNGSVKDGYDDVSLFEYLYATTTVTNVSGTGTHYGDEVLLDFKHLNSKINIAFWEDIAGYTVNMENLISDDVQISAAPTTRTGSDPSSYAYEYCNNFIKEASATIDFTTTPATLNLTSTKTYNNSVSTDKFQKYLIFKKPTASSLAEQKANINEDDRSSTTYYGIPNSNNCGLTFHVSFTLTAKQTGEKIKVQNATVYVPAEVCKWAAGYQYTYIFKITKKTSGTTGDPGTIDPSDPQPGNDALYPIIFDGITISDWTTATDSDHNIN